MFASRINTAFAQLRNEVDGCEKDLIRLIQVKKMMSEKSMEINIFLENTIVLLIFYQKYLSNSAYLFR